VLLFLVVIVAVVVVVVGLLLLLLLFLPHLRLKKIVQKHVATTPRTCRVGSGDYVLIEPLHVMTHDNTLAVIKHFLSFGKDVRRFMFVLAYAVMICTKGVSLCCVVLCCVVLCCVCVFIWLVVCVCLVCLFWLRLLLLGCLRLLLLGW